MDNGIMKTQQSPRRAPQSTQKRGLYFRRWAGLIGAGLLIMWGGLSGCGDAVDKPEDCTSVEYYNEATKLCTPCAAAVVPTCEPGCGFVIARDDNSCPIAECAAECRCEEGAFFSDETLSCVACAQADMELLICAE